jgi:hypothetical protein
MVGSCKRGNESSGFIRCGVFNDKISDSFRGITQFQNSVSACI